MFAKTLFIALALFMVIGASTAADKEVHFEKRGIKCLCNSQWGTYWFFSFNRDCCPSVMGKCCL
ncbi:U-actitoxin-Bgr3b-like [Tubulanus polymorphus]|uniref:U-actitoxin-Bgr3b-like n=1 Tax=Tubulanus polymorphus TaxID=672921 RepID=UPI003DA5D99E